MRQQPILWLAAILFIGGTVAGAASIAGSQTDPLISKSYALGTYISQVTQQAKNQVKDIFDTKVTANIEAVEKKYSTAALETEMQAAVIAALQSDVQTTLSNGQTLTANQGTEVVLTQGSAVVSSGTWINLTTGKLAQTGQAVSLNQMYLSADDGAVFTFRSQSNLQISGTYQIGQTASSTGQAQYTAYADALHTLGLFSGTSKGYELERTATRLEGIVMLIRLLGKEQQAIAFQGKHPFTDVPDWANSYVAYAYQNGYTSGVDASTFGATMNLRYLDYMTFLLRALGHSDTGGDFSWSTADQTAVDVGIQTAQERQNILNTGKFLRDHVAYTSYRTLFAKSKTGTRLCDTLIRAGVFSQNQLDAVEQKGL